MRRQRTLGEKMRGRLGGDRGSDEIGAGEALQRAPGSTEREFSPLALMPAGLPASQERAWRRLAKVAGRQARAAIKLKCLDCAAWYRLEAAQCEITTCPLWALNRRIFGRPAAAADHGEGAPQGPEEILRAG